MSLCHHRFHALRGGIGGTTPPFRLIIRGSGGLGTRKPPAPPGRIERCGFDRAVVPGAFGGGIPARYGGPGREARVRLRRAYWAWRSRSAISESTFTKSVSSPLGTIA
jgi:hypothetical protein